MVDEGLVRAREAECHSCDGYDRTGHAPPKSCLHFDVCNQANHVSQTEHKLQRAGKLQHDVYQSTNFKQQG